MFTKLFSSITTSSIWNEDNNTRIVWITMLAMANKNGYVAASIGGLAHEARVTREDCEKALKVLSSSDIDSRSKEFDGRRVEIVDGGFQLLNHAKYRAMRSEEERKEYMKSYMIEYRARTKSVNKSVNKVSECKPPLAQAEAEAEAEAEKNICPFEAKFMDNIGSLYKRRPSTAWDGNEMRKVREIMKRPEWQSELAEIQKLYNSGYKYRRQNIITLLNQWSGELDRSRMNLALNHKTIVSRPSLADIEARDQ